MNFSIMVDSMKFDEWEVFSPHNLKQWGKPSSQILLPQLYEPVKTDCIVCAGTFYKKQVL